jgi:hypothetical protein
LKSLNRIFAVSVIASATFAAHAQIKELDDSAMSNVTGQAGVTIELTSRPSSTTTTQQPGSTTTSQPTNQATNGAGISIELSTQINIGSVVYTDEGKLALHNVAIGGSLDPNTGKVNGALKDVLADIDIAADGTAIIDVHSISGAPIKYAMSVDSAALQDSTGAEGTQLASNINLQGYIGALNVQVLNSAKSAGTQIATAHDSASTPLYLGINAPSGSLLTTLAFSVDDMNLDLPFLGMGIRGLSMHGYDYNSGNGSYFASTQVLVNTLPDGFGNDLMHVSLVGLATDMNVNGVYLGGRSIGSLAVNKLYVSADMVIYGH